MSRPRTTPTTSLSAPERYVCAACPVHTGECHLCGTFWFIRGTKRYGVSPVEKATPVLTSKMVDGRQRWFAPRFEDLPNVQVQRACGPRNRG